MNMKEPACSSPNTPLAASHTMVPVPAPVTRSTGMPSASMSLRVCDNLVHDDGDGFAPLLGAAHVLRLAVVGLQPGEPEGGVLADFVGQGHGLLARRDAATVLAHVDLHENVDHGGRAVRLRAWFIAWASRVTPSALSTAIASRPFSADTWCASAATRASFCGAMTSLLM